MVKTQNASHFKALNQTEVELLCEELNKILLNAQLQDVYQSHLGLVLKLHAHKTTHFLLFFLDPMFPIVVSHPSINNLLKKTGPKPITLFTKAHATNGVLTEIRLVKNQGRVLQFAFKTKESLFFLDFYLIPRHMNLVAYKDEKKLSWLKETPLTSIVESGPFPTRPLETITSEWISFWQKKPQRNDTSNNSIENLKKQLEKKTTAVEKMKTTINSQNAEPWFQVGELLKYQSIKDLLPLWSDYLDSKKSITENMNFAFTKAKQLVQKQRGAKDRLQLVEQEIEDLKKRIENFSVETLHTLPSDSRSENSPLPKKLNPSVSKFRKIEISSEAHACIGKSGKDNLALLRHSRPWDYWLHFKDYPGAHAILFINKNTQVTDTLLTKVATWLSQETFKSSVPGSILEIIYTQCRFVRPIKGDKLGRVQHQKSKVLKIKV